MWVIRNANLKFKDGTPTYWNDELGLWVTLGYATRYTQAQMEQMMWAPIGGEWVEMTVEPKEDK